MQLKKHVREDIIIEEKSANVLMAASHGLKNGDKGWRL
jgi:hypothetical protein